MTNATNIALIGGGQFAKGAHLPAIASTPSLTLKAVYSRSQESATSVHAALSSHSVFDPSTISLHFDSPSPTSSQTLDALLANKEIGTVVVGLPISHQPAFIELAWKAGKNVVSEKPVAKDLETARKLIELYEREYKPKGITWIVAEQFAYEPSFNKAAELLASGAIGDLRMFALDYNNNIVSTTKSFDSAWRKTPDFQGGYLLDGGVHMIAGLRHILPPNHQLAQLSAIVTYIQSHLAPTDTVHGIALTTSNLPGSFKITWGIESTSSRTYTFLGSKGKLVVDFSPRDGDIQLVTITPADGSKVNEFKIKANAMASEFEAFGKALQGGLESEEGKLVQERSGARATLRDLEVIEKALGSGGILVKLVEGLDA